MLVTQGLGGRDRGSLRFVGQSAYLTGEIRDPVSKKGSGILEDNKKIEIILWLLPVGMHAQNLNSNQTSQTHLVSLGMSTSLSKEIYLGCISRSTRLPVFTVVNQHNSLVQANWLFRSVGWLAGCRLIRQRLAIKGSFHQIWAAALR